MKNGKVFYRYWPVGDKWCYLLNGNVRTGFESAEKAGIAMRSEFFYLRSCRRAENREPMTFADERTEKDT